LIVILSINLHFKLMKKAIQLCFTAVLLLVLMPLNAQSNFGAGVKAGINLSTQTTPGSSEGIFVNQLLRINAGGYCNYFFYDKFALQAELLISGKGSDWNDPDYDVKDLLTYIDVPIMIRFQPVKYLNFHAGLQPGMLLAAKQKSNETGETIDIKDYYYAGDLSLVFGAEANLPYNLNVTLRYVLGLTTGSNDVGYVDPWMNKIIQISLGYRILGK